MPLFDKFKKQSSKPDKQQQPQVTSKPTPKMTEIHLPAIGNTDPICPYCNQALDKKPAQKKKCPNCGNNIYVRTRPADRMKVLVTEQQVAQIEEQWQQYYDQKEKEKCESDPEYRQMKAKLAKKWGVEPSVNDIRWALANEHLIEHAKNLDWGLYRNVKLEMAQILKKEKKQKQALQTFLEVCYIDLNGPMNRGGLNDPKLLKQYPPFDPKQAFLAPGVIDEINELTKEMPLETREVRIIFLEIATMNYQSLKLRVEPQQAWGDIQKVLL